MKRHDLEDRDKTVFNVKRLQGYPEWKDWERILDWLYEKELTGLLRFQSENVDNDKAARILYGSQRVLQLLERIRNVTEFMDKKDPREWNQVVDYLLNKEDTGNVRRR